MHSAAAKPQKTKRDAAHHEHPQAAPLIADAGSDHVHSPSGETSPSTPANAPLDVERFLVDLADALNTTLDLDTLLSRVSDLVNRVIPFEIFAILLLNEKTQELRMRFQLGHEPEVERIRIKVGHGITGRCAQTREPVLVNDVLSDPDYINAHAAVRSELAVPLIRKNRIIGVIDIQSAKPGYFQPEHSRLLMLLASRIAGAIENARLYTRVYRHSQTLQVLNDISREVTSILNLDELLKRIGELLSKVIDFQMFSILLLDPSRTRLQHRFSVRFRENIHLKHEIPFGRGLIGAAAESGKAVLASDVTKDPRYIMANPETRSELCVPLIYKGGVIGVLDLEHTRRGFFNEDHIRTMTTLAAQIAIAIENARLYERIALEEQRLERDLVMAREVQMHLLPQCCPVLRDAEVAARFVPAYQIGGDIYDFLPYSGGQMGIAVGDVSGKGAPAALFAAMVGGILRSTAGMEPSPSEMLHSINLALNERKIEAQFMAMLYALWDDESRTMRIANSGQPRPVFCRGRQIEVIEATGLPLGLFDDAEYDEVAIQAAPGDAFVLFSDGIIDALNREEERFGRHRVGEVVRKNCDLSAENLVDAIFTAVEQFCGGTPAFDDNTVVVIKVREGEKTAPEIARRTRRTTAALRKV